MLCDYGLSRTLPESVQGKHNGQTHKVRQSVLRKLDSETPESEIRDQINKKAQKIQRINNKHERCISPHVSSRWYRAPEVILLQKKYDQAVDIYSAGCTFYEILSGVKSLNTCINDKKILYKGKHCFPLSPNPKNPKGYIDETDQLRIIFETRGRPDETDLGFVQEKGCYDHVKR